MTKLLNPYQIIKSRYVTEKSQTLQKLKTSESNSCVRKCETPKYVFLVDPKATKKQIKEALEQIYRDLGINVTAVNTINIKPKKKRVRGKSGMKSGFKKAVVSLSKNDSLDDV